MHRRLVLIWSVIAVTSASVGLAWAEPFEDGLAAYARGEYAAAERLWRPLAEQGVADAQFNLGFIFDVDDYLPEDPEQLAAQYRRATEAVKWYRRAAQQGHKLAQFNLGLLYETGTGVPRDDEVALLWYELAAAQGDTAAMDRRAELVQSMPAEQIASARRRAAAFRPRAE